MIDSECQWAKKIIGTPEDAEVISDQLVAHIDRHNELVEKHCNADS